MGTQPRRWLRLNRPVALRITAALFCAAVILTLLPMVLVALDNRPYYDDFAAGGRMTNSVWSRTGSVFALLSGAWDVMGEMFVGWEGNFVSNFLNAIQLGSLSVRLTFLVTVGMLAALGFAAYRLCKALLCVRLGLGRAAAWLATAVLVFVSVQFVPHPNEAFFWQSGAVKYTLAHGAMMLTIAVALRVTAKQPPRHPRGTAVLLCGLAVLCSGFNLMTGIAVTLGLWMAAAALWGTRSCGRAPITLAAVAALVAYLINVAAPGNAIRNNGFISPSAVATILQSLYATVEYIGRWTTLPILGLVVLTGALVLAAAPGDGLLFRHPLWVLAGSFAALAAELAPPIYAGTYYDSGRIVNTVYLSYCVWILLNTVATAGWLAALRAKTAKQTEAGNGQPGHSPDAAAVVPDAEPFAAHQAHNPGTVARSAWPEPIEEGSVSPVRRGLSVALAWVCVALIAVGSVGYGLRKMPGGASLEAIRTGQARRYAAAYDERTLTMESADAQETVRIDPIDDVPLVFMDEGGSWHSIPPTYSLYYQKNIIGSSE